MIQDAIRQVVERKDLSAADARAVMGQMMDGKATNSQIASFITAMRMKGETEDELVGFARAMRDSSARIHAPDDAVDMCGTGGDGTNTFNISTVASFVVAAAGVPVAKHGNRSVSSKCGSADVLSALGLPHDLPPAMVQECLRACSLGFMFAPIFHSSMRNVMVPRREVGIRTFFNLLGPMTNPAGVRNQLIGVYDASLAPTVARVLRSLGTERAMIVNGSGMDEFTVLGKTRVVELNGRDIREYDVVPGTFGMDLAEPGELAGGDPAENSRIMMSVLKGKPSPRSDVVALNAGAGIHLSGRAENMDDGIEMARDALASGAALKKLLQFSEVSCRLEADRQRAASPNTLSCGRLNTDVLIARSKEITDALLSDVSGNDRARMLLRNIDTRLIEEPNVLSVILLRRIVSVAANGITPSGDVHPLARSRTKLSQAIASYPGIAIIAEYKPRSPSTPPLQVAPEPTLTVSSYSRGGAVGVSVLAEPDFFSGSADLFASIRSMTRLPMLFKDFIVSEEQIEAASMVGADSVLLIAQALTVDALGGFIEASVERGLEPLVEMHDSHDIDKLARCARCHQVKMVGINSRDLRTLKVDLARFETMMRQIGGGRLVVAESGVSRSGDFDRLRGCDAALIGSAFMNAEDLDSKVRDLVSAGRGVVK
jgi:anthranilate phosphoribosyltransferase